MVLYVRMRGVSVRLEILASFSELFEKHPRVYSYKCLIVVDDYKPLKTHSIHI